MGFGAPDWARQHTGCNICAKAATYYTSKFSSSPAATQTRFKWSKRFILGSSAAADVSQAVASGGDPAHAHARAAAVPRTGNALLWCGCTFYEYTRLKAAHPQQSGSDYYEALDATHTVCADRLLQLC